MTSKLMGLLAAVSLCCTSLLAQTSSGTITGLVTDSSGAAIPGATITVTNTDTNATRDLSTDDIGNYVAARLLPGNYKVEAAFEGFQAQSKIGLVLSLDQTMRIDFTLAPGEQVTQITVVEQAAQLLQTSNATLGEVIEESLIKELPLNGRDFKQLIGLTAGAQPAPAGGFAASTFNINGTRGEGNLFLVDGLDVSGFASGDGIRVLPQLEGLGEFKIITNNFSAEYGRSFSGVISVHVKSGTNDFHGSLFHFLRNRELDARNFFDRTKAKYIFNQFGGSIGGPIVKNKLFFFFDYQGTRIRQGSANLSTIADQAQRNGDFSATATPIYDPLTNPKTQFPNNKIPVSQIDQPSALMFSILPLPNQAGAFNYFKQVGRYDNRNDADIRIDYHLSSADRFSFVNTIRKGNSGSESIFPRLSGHLIVPISEIDPRSYSLNYTRVIGANGVNELIVGWKRDNFFGPTSDGMQYEPDLGVPGLNESEEDIYSTGFPMYLISGFALFGGPAGGPFVQVNNIPQLTDNFSWSAGRHYLKTGFSWRSRQFNLGQSVWPRGQNNFNTLPTSNNGSGGHSLASALLGLPTSVVRDVTPPWGERIREYGFYFQDDFKVNAKLTLNLGLRYDLLMPSTEAHDRLANFDPATVSMVLANEDGRSASTLIADKNNFGPRLGFAYRFTEDGKTVLRGGYGIGYVPLVNVGVGTANTRLTTQVPFKRNFAQSGLNFGRIDRRVSDGLPLPQTSPDNPNGDQVYVLEKEPTPYTQSYNLGIQRTLPGNFIADVTYAGSRGVHLTSQVNINQARPGQGPSGPRSLISPNVNIVLGLFNRGSSTYHSMQAKLQRRFAGGFSLMSAYTYAHTIDDGSYVITSSSSSNASPQDSLDWRPERGNADFDLRHRFVTSFLYELPIGRGKAVGGNMHPVLNGIVGGWQINGIVTLQSGQVFTPIVQNQRTNSGPGGDIRPHRIGNGELPSDERSVTNWFDKTAFTVPVFEFGNSGRNFLRGPAQESFDFSTFKDFKISERFNVQFRAEFFNLFNHANFTTPNKAVDIPQGGTFSTALAPRQIQFGLKLLF